MNTVVIGGLTPLSSLDYPDALSAVVYCQGCPWDCPYCHNQGLRTIGGQGERSPGEVLAWLATRRGLLDAVVFSGGEPTLHAGLAALMAAVRELGFKVGLHTSGMFPAALAEVVRLTDWVGLDVKAPLDSYDHLTGQAGSGRAALASLGLLAASGVDFETRTTWHPDLVSETELGRLARELATAKAGRWFLQAFRPDGCADAALAKAGPTVIPAELAARLQALAPELAIAIR